MSNYFDGFRIDQYWFFPDMEHSMDAVQGILGILCRPFPYPVEFAQRNIWFDHERYTRLYHDAVLWEIFGNDSEHVKDAFSIGPGPTAFMLYGRISIPSASRSLV